MAAIAACMFCAADAFSMAGRPEPVALRAQAPLAFSPPLPLLTAKSLRSTSPLQVNGWAARGRGVRRGREQMSLVPSGMAGALTRVTSTPDALFQTIFLGLAAVAALANLAVRDFKEVGKKEEEKPEGVKNLQIRFLIVFWLLRMADWLQGPYFYEVYASKIIGGSPVSLDLVSKLFLIGFGTTGLLGAYVGKLVDSKGRRAGTLAFTILYTIGALSTKSSLLWVLILGRLAGGVGTSLLFSAPESWLVGEHNKKGYDGKWLGQTFGWAYAGDSLVAISAGQLAGAAAAARGPAGPFEISVVFLAAGALLAATTWKENVAPKRGDESSGPTIGDAWRVMLKDKKILLVGIVQALFEGAMYIFVLQWPPSLIAVVSNGQVPFGKVFSCFMASCLIGSTLFGALSKKGVEVETRLPCSLEG
eukprot:748050-Hanusia_phi.AAC.3